MPIMTTGNIGHISFLSVRKRSSKAALLRKQLETILRIDKQIGRLADIVPEYSEAYPSLNKARSDLSIAGQHLQGCNVEDLTKLEFGATTTPVDEVICLGKKTTRRSWICDNG